MTTVITETELRQLSEGDLVKYHGVQWQVDDYSIYTDDKGYETEEWSLKSQSGREYCLMREVDPQNPESQIHWYVAEELRYPEIYEPKTSRDLAPTLIEEMQLHRSPYPELRMLNRTYRFESQTEGNYESDGETCTRITWDYWDEPHLWNLALEAWNTGKLAVYSTREVQPADFTDIQTGQDFTHSTASHLRAPGFGGTQSQNRMVGVNSSRQKQLVIAWAIVIVGVLLMMFGI